MSIPKDFAALHAEAIAMASFPINCILLKPLLATNQQTPWNSH